ncbi:hypothetical protein [Pseudomonas fragi]|uniref:hypothetical protein n=1 Tax=Pseudomonas fragi TaxID=296 RepID=UPI0030A650A4
MGRYAGECAGMPPEREPVLGLFEIKELGNFRYPRGKVRELIFLDGVSNTAIFRAERLPRSLSKFSTFAPHAKARKKASSQQIPPLGTDQKMNLSQR